MCSSPQPNGPSSQPPSPDLSAIAALLIQTAQTLLNVNSPPMAEREPKQQAAPREEIRCYRFTPLAVQCEQELFRAQGAANLQEVLFNASCTLTALGALLERIDPEAYLEGMTLHMLGRELQRVGKVLFKIQDAYSTVELVKA